MNYQLLKEEKTMQTQTQLEKDRLVEQKIQKLRDVFADAPQMAKTALEN